MGKSLLFLLESELGFLRYLKEAKVPLNEFVFPADRIENVQFQVCCLFPQKVMALLTLTPIAGKFAGEELQPVSISDAGIPGIPAVICIVFVKEDL